MTRTVRKITALLLALVMTAAAFVLIPPVNASAGRLIDYSISYSGKYVKLRLIPVSSSDTIYYTANNTKPTTSSTVYKKQLAASAKTVIRAVEYSKTGRLVASLKLTITPRAQKPVFTENIKGGKLTLTLKSATSGAKIYYTTDGSTPDKSSKKYSGAIEYKRGMTITARAYANGLKASQASTFYLSDSEYSAVTGNSSDNTVSTADGDASEEAAEVVRLLNEERESRGLAPLTMDPKLVDAAEVRVNEVAVHFSHDRPDGRDNFTVLDELGINYMCAAENIAGGQRSASAVINSWMNSSGHRANMLSPDYGKIGVGHICSDGMDYWVQVFTN